jgi:hypothetical protein|tara:strand:- start:510 stop:701 length:192 start_codon:yes stop_codon:yes gene_type:complete
MSYVIETRIKQGWVNLNLTGAAASYDTVAQAQEVIDGAVIMLNDSKHVTKLVVAKSTFRVKKL